tara:strand:+ start:310 stop:1278 length:969 start_codon:yes stop_codon:yes gene_type:complete
MSNKPILIVAGEPNSVFLEILFKAYKIKKFSSPLILIASHQLLRLQMKALKFKKKVNLLDFNKLNQYKLDNSSINLINEDFKTKKAFQKINNNSNNYINNCLKIAVKLIKSGFSDKLINGPISKKNFLNKKFLGMTEYFANEFKKKNVAMLIYNKSLSVCPITTHLPLKSVTAKIDKKLIVQKVNLINNFYKKIFGFKPRIAVTGLNPHCESIDIFNEDSKILTPAIKYLKKSGIRIFGPFPADTIFLKNNRKNFDVVLGMYHDQVLTPIKTLYEYNAINITLGLPFIRISPDHGPNERMMGKNTSNPLSLIEAIKFLDKTK